MKGKGCGQKGEEEGEARGQRIRGASQAWEAESQVELVVKVMVFGVLSLCC